MGQVATSDLRALVDAGLLSSMEPTVACAALNV
jgi:hypothetical protein